MNIMISVALLIIVLLFYLSNPNNSINKWCAAAGLLFWLGVAKEAVLYNIIPLLSNADSLQADFVPIYSICTWAIYSLAMPTTVIFALYFCDLDKTGPKLLRLLKNALYLPALTLSFFFQPLEFRVYQLSSMTFWTAYAVHNLGLGAVFTWLMLRGVRLEKPGRNKTQKMRVGFVILPLVLFWLVSVFLTHPFQLQGLFKLWQLNAFLMLGSAVAIVVMAFRDGFMGLHLSKENYHWNTNMDIINTGADYMSHMLKNQTIKLELCIEQLQCQYVKEESPEELAIMSRSISNLKNYVGRMKRLSQNIHLSAQPCKLSDLVRDAMPASLMHQNDIKVNSNIGGDVFWVCDKTHMTEAFSNIISNAIDAMSANGTIDITGTYGKSHYLLKITDNGIGMNDIDLHHIFIPYFTTKNTEKNFGLGLAYCKNVINKHGGSITAKSEPGHGTTVAIAFPSRRVAAGGNERSEQNV